MICPAAWMVLRASPAASCNLSAASLAEPIVPSAFSSTPSIFFEDSENAADGLAQVIERLLQVIHVRLRKRLVIQPVERGVDLRHGSAQILDQSAAFLRHVVETLLTRSLDPRAFRDVGRRFSRRRSDGDETIPEQARAADRESSCPSRSARNQKCATTHPPRGLT